MCDQMLHVDLGEISVERRLVPAKGARPIAFLGHLQHAKLVVDLRERVVRELVVQHLGPMHLSRQLLFHWPPKLGVSRPADRPSDGLPTVLRVEVAVHGSGRGTLGVWHVREVFDRLHAVVVPQVDLWCIGGGGLVGLVALLGDHAYLAQLAAKVRHPLHRLINHVSEQRRLLLAVNVPQPDSTPRRPRRRLSVLLHSRIDLTCWCRRRAGFSSRQVHMAQPNSRPGRLWFFR